MRPCLHMPARWSRYRDWRNRWHVRLCPECRRARSVDRELLRAASQLRRPTIPDGLEERILQRMGVAAHSETAIDGTKRRPTAPWRVALPTAAILAILAVGLYHRWTGRPSYGVSSRIALSHLHGPSPELPQAPVVGPAAPPRQPVPTVARRGLAVARAADVTERENKGARERGNESMTEREIVYSFTPSLLYSFTRSRAPSPPRFARLAGSASAPRDDFIRVPPIRLASASDQSVVAAAASQAREAAVVDARLSRTVTLAFKGTALADVCDHLRAESGVALAAGQSVADEKVSLFCEEASLRDVMRQLSRPFGYTWLRSGPVGAYRYELVQDLRSQLLEEELRNQDRNAALLALEREIEQYRTYLSLTPDEARARAATATPVEKKLLTALARKAWGPIRMYFRLSSQDLAALRAGQELRFSTNPRPGERLLPPEVGRGVLQGLRDWRLVRQGERYRFTDPSDPRGLPPSAIPEARGLVKLSLSHKDLGQFVLDGHSGLSLPGSADAPGTTTYSSDGPLAIGSRLPTPRQEPRAKSQEPAVQRRVSVEPRHSCSGTHGTATSPPMEPGTGAARKVTSADVMEALHRATGLPVVADFYTLLHEPKAVSCRNVPLLTALNQLADTLGARWSRDGSWLQLRSASFYDDRLKEVPNRLLHRWAAARARQGGLSLEDLVEIARLSDVQLDAAGVAEGARECFGLAEWRLLGYGALRPHLRYLGELTPAQRQEALGPTGLAFTRMSLAQQRRFLDLGFPSESTPLQSLRELEGAALRVEYTQPGWFQWGNSDDYHPTRWVLPLSAGPEGRRVLRPSVRERTREAAARAVRRIDPQLRDAIHQARRRDDPRQYAVTANVESELYPSRLGLVIVYIPGGTNARPIHVWFENSDIVLPTDGQ